jgi:DNA-binding NarL/FixJ family response regulator
VTPKVRIVICDDHAVVREGLKTMLDRQPDFEVVAEAGNGREAVESARRYRPDVVLMDLRMPGMDGVAAIGRIKEEQPKVGVLVLTTYETDADILAAVERGASGFLLKDAAHEELFAAIRSVHEGNAPLSPSIALKLVERLRGGAGEEVLSAREVEILRLVARGTANREIARQLWISEATVKSHLNRILKKLGAPDRTAAVTEALKRNIIRLE